MKKEELFRSRVIRIPSKDCTWSIGQRKILIKGDDWSGCIPNEELEIEHKNGGIMIHDIMFLLSNPSINVMIKEIMPSGEIVFSRKKYLMLFRDSIEVGKVYNARIKSVCEWGCFVDVEGFIVLVPAIQFSKCRFLNLKSVCPEIGEYMKIKITKKFIDESGNFRLEGSRRQVESSQKYEENDLIWVIVGNPVGHDNGYFCEVTSDCTGIIDIPYEFINSIYEGNRVLARVKKLTSRGYKLDFVSF